VSGAVVGGVVAVLALAALAPWWARGDAARVRVALLARGDAGGAGVGAVGDGAGGFVAAEAGAAGIDAEVVLALVAAACCSGASVARALDAVGAAVGGPDGAGWRSVASRLALGSGWDDAWVGSAGGSGRPESSRRGGGLVGRVLRDALRPTWEHGAPPEPALRAAADQLRRSRAERSATAAGRLGVRLVLPLGLCYLPAFVLVGLVPVLVSYGVGLLGAG